MTITEDEAGDLLREDIQSSEDAVNRLVTVPITQGQYDALVSFVFNLGRGNLASSTLLRLLNSGDYTGAAEQFPRWNQAAGKVLQGLVTRRAAEARMFTGPVSLA
jgi:lysozyme